MKTKTKLFIAFAGLLVISASTLKETSGLKKAEWLIGTWENKTAKGSIFETWNKISDNEFSGKSYLVKEKDTVVFETIQVVQEQDLLFYIPLVKNQNNGLPVRFTGNTISETQLIFENPQHDFPQKISYTKFKSDSLVAEISGIQNGQQRKQTFIMKRVK